MDDVTEITDLDVQKVSGVDNPASGTPFLFMKSAANGRQVIEVPGTGADHPLVKANQAKEAKEAAKGCPQENEEGSKEDG